MTQITPHVAPLNAARTAQRAISTKRNSIERIRTYGSLLLGGSITIGLEQNLVMNTKLFLLCCLSAATAYAADPPSSQFKSSTPTPNSFDQSAQFQGFLTRKDTPSVLVIGRSDFTFSGPLIYGFRRLPHEDNLSRGEKFLRLPLIRLFVPGPMPMPPEGGPKYFAWKSEQYAHAWPVSASRQSIVRGAAGSLDEAAGREPAGTLLQIGF